MRLSAHDASFLYQETASGPMHSVGITVLDGHASFADIYEYYARRIHLVPRLRQRAVFVPFNVGHPVWVDDPDFDLANHIKPHQMPPNTTLNRAIERAMELGEPLLDRSRPLWLTYVIENIKGKTLLVQMSHHAFVDGATAVAMSTVLTDAEPDAADPPQPKTRWQPERLPTQIELWQQATRENLETGVQQLQQAIANAAELEDVNQKAGTLMARMSQPVMQAPWNAGLVGPKRKVTTLVYTMDDFRPIRKVLGGTINDIVVSVVAEGAARYLVSKGEVVEDQFLRLMCPVNVRDEADDPLDMGGNRVSAMFPLVAAKAMPMTERFLQVIAELNEIKQNDEPLLLDRLQHLQPSVPPIAMAQTQSVGTTWDPTAAAARAPLPVVAHPGGPRPQQGGFNFTCTNVAGPTWKRYVAGCEVLSTTGTLMLSGNLGLGVAVGSYDGTFSFVFTVDPRLVPDVDKLAGFVDEAFAELRASARPADPSQAPASAETTLHTPKSSPARAKATRPAKKGARRKTTARQKK